jgi:hypothetical protein
MLSQCASEKMGVGGVFEGLLDVLPVIVGCAVLFPHFA